MIQTPEDFCQWLQPDASIRSVQKSLYWLLSLRSARKKRQEYQVFWLAKRGGGYRPVAAPSLGLKKVQRGIPVSYTHLEVYKRQGQFDIRTGRNILHLEFAEQVCDLLRFAVHRQGDVLVVIGCRDRVVLYRRLYYRCLLYTSRCV